MSYSDYLKTDHWQKVRTETLINHPNCVICDSSKNLQIHHKKYQYKGESILFNEAKKDLYTLCASCHRLIHHYFGIEVHKLNKIKLRIRRLLELGIVKNKAFWIVSNPDLYVTVLDKAKSL